MNDRTQGIGRLTLMSVVRGLAELLFFLPVPLASAVYLLPRGAALAWLLTLPLSYGAGAWAAARLPSRRRIQRLLWAALAGGAHLFVLLALSKAEMLQALPLIVVGAFAAWRGMAAALRSWEAAFPSGAMLIGIVIHIAAQAAVLGLDKLAPYGTLLALCGIGSVIVFFFLSNDRLIGGETGASSAARQFKRQNRLMAGAVMVVILLLGLFRQLQQGIEGLGKSLIAAIAAWFSRPSEEAPAEEPPMNEAPPMLPGAEPKEPSEWMVWLEQAFRIVGTVLVAVILLVALYFLVRKLSGLVRKALDRLLERSEAAKLADAGYTDEVESLMTLSTLKEEWKDRLRDLLPGRRRGPEWDAMQTVPERVRFLYRMLLQRSIKAGYPYKPQLTPRETASDLAAWRSSLPSDEERELAELYDRVRYGEEEPAPDRLEELKRKLDQRASN